MTRLSTQTKRTLLASTGACLLLAGSGHYAKAIDFQFNNGIDIRFDNTVQYSLLERVAPESSQIADSINVNDGDNNLRSGIVSNRVDLLTKFDISDNGYGFDTTVDSFYDAVYNQHSLNHSADSYNPAQEPPYKFTSATRTQSGRDVELRNLFIYGSNSIAGIPVTVRVGRLVNLFGESLFFAANGISYGQAPIDIQRASSVPNTQAKDLFLPVGQALITAQLSDAFSLSAYYQFEWEKFKFNPAGSYFSTADLLDQGGQRIIAVPAGTPGFPPNTGGYFYRTKDESGADTGQFGAALHYDPEGTSYDFGLYALQYNDSEPQVYVRPFGGPPRFIPGTPGTPNALALGVYQTVYADHIQIYGVSTSTTVGPLNLAGEVSARLHEDLVSSVTVLPGQNANNNRDPLYATGNTLHYQVSEIYLGSKQRFWDGSSIVGEAAGDNLLGFDKNRDNFDRAVAQHFALGLRTIVTLNYYQVFPGLDVNPDIGLGWNFRGKAPDTQGFNNTGIDRGGDITFGVSTTYLNKWTGGISYTRYISPPGRDPYADRDYVAFNVERTF